MGRIMLRHIEMCVLTLALLASLAFASSVFSGAALSSPAMAAEPDLPPPDPADAVYTITLEADMTNTARCLGEVDTPLCALETFLACKKIIEMRSNPACGKVGYALPPPPHRGAQGIPGVSSQGSDDIPHRGFLSRSRLAVAFTGDGGGVAQVWSLFGEIRRWHYSGAVR